MERVITPGRGRHVSLHAGLCQVGRGGDGAAPTILVTSLCYYEHMFDRLGIEIKELGAVDPDTLTDAELADALVEVHTQREAFAAAEARLTRAFDARTIYAADGARSAAAWLAHRTRSPKQACAARVRLGRVAQHMPLTAAAW